jgi:putative component of toxin-antitoxin plasmid stabilization module
MIEVREYLDREGGSPFADWFADLNPKAADKVATALTRLVAGNFSSVRIQDRLWAGIPSLFRQRRDRLMIVLGGGSKKRQQHDIDAAAANWQDYKRRKKEDKYGADT